MLTRRDVLVTGGMMTVGLMAPGWARAADVVEIQMKANAAGTETWFDPIGVHIMPGQRIRWIVGENVHTTTAYHPRNDMHALRIPERATPWDSGYLRTPGDHFEVTFHVEGVYDYFCTPHEMLGMVGRIVVGRPGGPGTLPFDYFKKRPGAEHWKPVPTAAQLAFPSVAAIVAQRIVRRGSAHARR